MAKKETHSKVSSLAAKVLSGSKKPTKGEVLTLAASALAQDEHKGARRKK